MIRTLNEDKVIVQELSLPLFPDFANLQSICAGGEDVLGEVTTYRRLCVAALRCMSPVHSVH